MKISIESSDEIIEGHGRVWHGLTERGVPCKVVVIAIGTEDEEALAAIQPELATLGVITSAYSLTWLRPADGDSN